MAHPSSQKRPGTEAAGRIELGPTQPQPLRGHLRPSPITHHACGSLTPALPTARPGTGRIRSMAHRALPHWPQTTLWLPGPRREHCPVVCGWADVPAGTGPHKEEPVGAQAATLVGCPRDQPKLGTLGVLAAWAGEGGGTVCQGWLPGAELKGGPGPGLGPPNQDPRTLRGDRGRRPGVGGTGLQSDCWGQGAGRGSSAHCGPERTLLGQGFAAAAMGCLGPSKDS